MRSGLKCQIVIVRTWDGPASKVSSPRLAFGVQDLGCELDRSRLHAFVGSFDNKQEQNELTHKAQHIIPFGNRETHRCHRAQPVVVKRQLLHTDVVLTGRPPAKPVRLSSAKRDRTYTARSACSACASAFLDIVCGVFVIFAGVVDLDLAFSGVFGGMAASGSPTPTTPMCVFTLSEFGSGSVVNDGRALNALTTPCVSLSVSICITVAVLIIYFRTLQKWRSNTPCMERGRYSGCGRHGRCDGCGTVADVLGTADAVDAVDARTRWMWWT